MKKVLLLFALLLMIPISINAEGKVKVYVFEAGDCPYCEAELEYLKTIDQDKIEIVRKELYIDHVDWEPGKDYELGVKVADAFKNAGFTNATYTSTPFVVISDLYAVSGYSTSLDSVIDYAYKEGDVHRVQNQQAVITAIIKKVSSNKSILLRYSSILDSLQGWFQTNVTMNEISALVNEQLNSMPDWQIAKYNLNGTCAHKSCYSMGAGELYVMIPDEETIDQASDYINDMIDGKTLEDLGLSE